MRLILALAGVMFLAACSAEPPQPARPPFYADLAQPGATLDAQSAEGIINAYRAGKGLAALSRDAALTGVADGEARRLARAGIVDDGKSPMLDAALRNAGFEPRRTQRGVAGGYHSIADAFSGMRGVPHHDGVLTSKAGRRYGLAAVAMPGSRHRVYWVLLVAP